MPKFKRKRRPRKKFIFRKRKCIFCAEKVQDIDYKDITRLNRFVSERGKIMPRRLTGACAKHQRKVVRAIKRARFIALLPFVTK